MFGWSGSCGPDVLVLNFGVDFVKAMGWTSSAIGFDGLVKGGESGGAVGADLDGGVATGVEHVLRWEGTEVHERESLHFYI